MSKRVIYMCNYCSKESTDELANGPVNIELHRSSLCIRRWTAFIHTEHICSNCLTKLEKAIDTLFTDFFKVPQ